MCTKVEDEILAERAFYSIDPAVLGVFNRLVSPNRRSKVIEQLMAQYVARDVGQIVEAATLIENDPGYSEVMSDSALLGFENLTRLEQGEDRRQPTAA